MSSVTPKDPREGHRQRLREKFLNHGLSKFTDAEVLELLLSFGTPRRDCKATARAMLKKFGTIREVFEASREELAGIAGAGPSNIVAIKFIHAVSGKYLRQRLTGKDYLESSKEILEYLRFEMESLDREIFKIIFLDDNNIILGLEDLSQGTINTTLADPRDIVKRSLAFNATALIVVHNHPSGNIQPSTADMRFTRRLVHVTHITGMLLCDHIIIGRNGEYFSFADKGMLLLYLQEVRDTYNFEPYEKGGLRHEQIPLVYNDVKLKPRKKREKAAAADEPLSAPAGVYVHSSRPDNNGSGEKPGGRGGSGE